MLLDQIWSRVVLTSNHFPNEPFIQIRPFYYNKSHGAWNYTSVETEVMRPAPFELRFDISVVVDILFNWWQGLQKDDKQQRQQARVCREKNPLLILHEHTNGTKFKGTMTISKNRRTSSEAQKDLPIAIKMAERAKTHQWKQTTCYIKRHVNFRPRHLTKTSSLTVETSWSVQLIARM